MNLRYDGRYFYEWDGGHWIRVNFTRVAEVIRGCSMGPSVKRIHRVNTRKVQQTIVDLKGKLLDTSDPKTWGPPPPPKEEPYVPQPPYFWEQFFPEEG